MKKQNLHLFPHSYKILIYYLYSNSMVKMDISETEQVYSETIDHLGLVAAIYMILA